jgi:hypothetical protein
MKVTIESKDVLARGVAIGYSDKPIDKILASAQSHNGIRVMQWYKEECTADRAVFETRQPTESVVKDLRSLIKRTINEGNWITVDLCKGKKWHSLSTVTQTCRYDIPRIKELYQIIEREERRRYLVSNPKYDSAEYKENRFTDALKKAHESLQDLSQYAADTLEFKTAYDLAKAMYDERYKAQCDARTKHTANIQVAQKELAEFGISQEDIA